MAGGQQTRSRSGPTAFYGDMTWGLPNRLYRNFVNPLIQGFGYGGRADKFRSGMDAHGGPLADYLKQVQGFSGSIIPQAQALGQQVSQQAPQLYGALQGQISGALDRLPGLQATGQGAVDKAQWLVDQAFSPINSRALYNETLSRAFEPARQNAAARGLLESGSAQQMEQDLGRDLAYNFAMQDQANQGGSLDRLTALNNNQLGLNTAGVGLAGAGMDALSNYLQLAQAGMNLPLSAAGNLFSLLSGGLAPGLQLSQITGPQQYSNSKGGGGNIL